MKQRKSIEKRAMSFVQKYLERKGFRKVENVEKNRDHPGYDFIARKGKKRFRIE